MIGNALAQRQGSQVQRAGNAAVDVIRVKGPHGCTFYSATHACWIDQIVLQPLAKVGAALARCPWCSSGTRSSRRPRRWRRSTASFPPLRMPRRPLTAGPPRYRSSRRSSFPEQDRMHRRSNAPSVCNPTYSGVIATSSAGLSLHSAKRSSPMRYTVVSSALRHSSSTCSTEDRRTPRLTSSSVASTLAMTPPAGTCWPRATTPSQLIWNRKVIASLARGQESVKRGASLSSPVRTAPRQCTSKRFASRPRRSRSVQVS